MEEVVGKKKKINWNVLEEVVGRKGDERKRKKEKEKESSVATGTF